MLVRSVCKFCFVQFGMTWLSLLSWFGRGALRSVAVIGLLLAVIFLYVPHTYISSMQKVVPMVSLRHRRGAVGILSFFRIRRTERKKWRRVFFMVSFLFFFLASACTQQLAMNKLPLGRVVEHKNRYVYAYMHSEP